MKPIELIEDLLSKGMTLSSVKKLLIEAQGRTHLMLVKQRYAAFKEHLLADILSRFDQFNDQNMNVDFLSKIDLIELNRRQEAFCNALSALESSNGYYERHHDDFFRKIGLESKSYRGHEIPDMCKVLTDAIDEHNLSDDYSIQLNAEKVYLHDRYDGWTAMFRGRQYYLYKDDKNWIAVCRDSIVICSNGSVFALKAKNDSEFTRVDNIDFNLLDVSREDVNNKYLAVEETCVIQCLHLGELYYKDNFEKWAVQLKGDARIGVIFEKGSGNYRDLFFPRKLFDGARFYVDSIGYIDGEASYFSVKGLFTQYWEHSEDEFTVDHKKDSWWMRDHIMLTKFAYYNVSDCIVTAPSLVVPKHDNYLKSDVPCFSVFSYGGSVREHINSIFERNGHTLERQRRSYERGVCHTDNFQALLEQAKTILA